MHIKIKKQNQDGEMRLETKGPLREIRIKENFMHPKREMVELCFRGANTSGIVEFSLRELEHISSEVKARLHLVKSVKVIRDDE